MKEPNCKNCWDKGFSTEYRGATIAHADFPEFGERDRVIAPPGVKIKYCKCRAGVNAKRRHKRHQNVDKNCISG